MRTFNSAYHVLVDHLADRGVTTSTAPSVGSARKPGERLSREEIERMVASINKPGPVDSFLNAVGWVGSRIEAAWFALFVVAATLRLTYLAFTGQFGELIQETKRHPELFFLLVALIGMGVAEVRRRSVLQEHGSSMGTHRLRERSGT